MSRPKRKLSPVSEGTLITGMFESGYNVLEETNMEEENASLYGGSSSDDFVDDTDEDPNFHPSNPDRKKPFSFLGPRKSLDFSKPSTSTDTCLSPPQHRYIDL